ncbi:lipopolysaccharide biosynthesis protein [Alkalibacillus haloalkaliphilus]|uniref:lipopolysaccharide biosynthesis protein n=1 Tax=Alkalibacillus haloalkaliphilus TaxID=94136 RepID=UPI0029362207|nr:lipopolysaccharide biosynthesis protein [Alkalibacillus haloalkaliphilus]MDV2582168.1 lipopolysaccharide biosynthesis protein [Alkalibacillus haloalkaliphilus]
MKNFLLKVSKKKFVRSVFIVASGTAAAQLLTVAFSPIITRIYGPESFGILGVFTATIAVLSPLSALTFPHSIVLPKSESEAVRLIKLSLLLSILTSSLALVIISIFNIIGIQFLVDDLGYLIYLLPIVMLFTGSLQVIQQWLFRTNRFKISAKAEFKNKLYINLTKVLFGLLHPFASTLVIIASVSKGLYTFTLYRSAKLKIKVEDISINFSELISTMNKYKDFPMFRAPQALLSAFSKSLPIILLGALWGPASAGFYSICNTVLGMPAKLIGNSVGNVLYPKVTEVYNEDRKVKPLILKSTLFMGLLGIVPFGLIVIIGPQLFALIFGEDWYFAGEYARWLSVLMYFNFICRPSIVVVPVLKEQGGLLRYELISVIVKVVVLLVGLLILRNDIIGVALFSISGSIMVTLLIVWVLYKCHLKDSKL